MLQLPLPLAAVFGLNVPEIVTFVIPLAGIILGGAIAVSAMYFKHQRRRLWHETARIALEKGQPLPTSADLHPPRTERMADGDIPVAHDIRGGMVLIAVGLGLWLMFGQFADRLRFVGAIPGFIGVALLLFGIGRVLFGRKPSERNDRAPRT